MLIGDLFSLGTRLVEAIGSAVNQSNASFGMYLAYLCLTCHTGALTQQAAWTLRAFAHAGRDCLFSFTPAFLLSLGRALFLLIFEGWVTSLFQTSYTCNLPVTPTGMMLQQQ